MARTKKITVNNVEYTLQSVTFTWYSAKYADALIKGCVTAPAEVAKQGLKYFDDQEDLATPGELVREIENFLGERN